MEKIEMVYMPVPDLQSAVDFYCTDLGWTLLWSEAGSTAGVQPAGSSGGLLLDVSTSGDRNPGPMLSVNSVRNWFNQHREHLVVIDEPSEIPGGWWARFKDASGHDVYVIDQSTAE